MAFITVALASACGGENATDREAVLEQPGVRVSVTSTWSSRNHRVEEAVERASRRQVSWADCLSQRSQFSSSVRRTLRHVPRTAQLCIIAFRPPDRNELWWVKRNRGRIAEVGRASAAVETGTSWHVRLVP
jgi:hypothetical protein